jgi:VWFA-related protein
VECSYLLVFGCTQKGFDIELGQDSGDLKMSYRAARFGGTIFLICVAATAGLAVGMQNRLQEQGQTYKVKTELVEIRAVVKDSHGGLVENLSKEDFELLEDGKPQEISFFTVSNAEPLNTSIQHKEIRSGSIRERLSAPPVRCTILYVDNLHLEFRYLNWVKRNLHRVIDEKMTDQDMMAIVTSDGNLGIAQQFTRDRRILRRAIEQIKVGPISWETPFSATLAGRIMRGDTIALEEGKEALKTVEHIEDDKSGSLTRIRAEMILSGTARFREGMLFTLNALIQQLAGMPGQRMIAIFSPGFTQNGRDGWPRYIEAQSVINRAVRSGIVLYSIDGNGLTADTPDPEKQDALVSLAKETGGEFYSNDNNLNGLLGRAFESNRFCYILAYYLKPASDADEFRSIKVRIRNHPEYSVRTPKGYSSSDMLVKAEEKETMPHQALIRAVNAPLPVSDLEIAARMELMNPQEDPQHVALTVGFEGEKLQYERQDQRHAFAVEILYVIYDSNGKQADGQAGSLQGSLKPEHLDRARINGYVFSKVLTLKPGSYQARVGIREVATKRTGTASAWIEVPDLRQSKIALSDLMFPDPASAINVDPLNAGTPKKNASVQGVRLFQHDKVCTYGFHVYQSASSSAHSDLTFIAELLKDGKPTKKNKWAPLVGEKNPGSKGPVYVSQKMDLAGMDPGIYELNVKVRDARSNRIAARTAVIGIE